MNILTSRVWIFTLLFFSPLYPMRTDARTAADALSPLTVATNIVEESVVLLLSEEVITLSHIDGARRALEMYKDTFTNASPREQSKTQRDFNRIVYRIDTMIKEKEESCKKKHLKNL